VPVSFDWPVALLALLLVPLLVALYVVRERRRTAFAAGFTNPALLPNVVDRKPGLRRHIPLILLLLGLTAIVLGVARPHATVSVKREEATVVLAMDVSRSMKAEDVEPTRLEAAQEAAKAFAEEVPEKFRIGVVSFATRAVVGLPPTEDRKLAESALEALKPGEGTAIGDAVALSTQVGRPRRASAGPLPPRSVLLISDGARDGGAVDPLEAARRAKQLKIPVYTVVVGTPSGVVEETLPGGLRQIIRVPPSPETLQQIAELSGGEFFTATDAEGLERVYEELGSRLGSRDELREVGDYFAGGAAALLLAGGALSAVWFRRVV
jgi:Ca-activated chloride channel family protein